MKKIFYSVIYNDWGFLAPHEMWFDDLEEARAFSNQDYHDNVIVHTCTRQGTIEKYERIIARQEAETYIQNLLVEPDDVFLGMGEGK